MLDHARMLSTVLLICAGATTACASIGRSWSFAPQMNRASIDRRPTPGNWEKVEALRPGAPLIITLNRRDRLEGIFKTLDSTALTLTDRAGKDITVQRTAINRIIARAKKDDVTNGVLIGAATGFGAALAILSALGSQDGHVLPSAKVGAPLLLSGAGALVGGLIDRAHDAGQLLYVAPRSSSRARP